MSLQNARFFNDCIFEQYKINMTEMLIFIHNWGIF